MSVGIGLIELLVVVVVTAGVGFILWQLLRSKRFERRGFQVLPPAGGSPPDHTPRGPMTPAIGLPGATELVVIVVLGVLVGGIVLTTFLIARSRRREGGRDGDQHAK